VHATLSGKLAILLKQLRKACPRFCARSAETVDEQQQCLLGIRTGLTPLNSRDLAFKGAAYTQFLECPSQLKTIRPDEVEFYCKAAVDTLNIGRPRIEEIGRPARGKANHNNDAIRQRFVRIFENPFAVR